MQNTKLLRGLLDDDLAAVAQTQANFPDLVLKIQEPDVTAGDGVSGGEAGTGKIVCPISGATFKPTGASNGWFKPGPAGTFGKRTAGVATKTGGAMPTLALKHPLMIVVRHAAAANDAQIVLGDSLGSSIAIGDGNTLTGWIAPTTTNYTIPGAVTFGAAGIVAYCAGMDRTKCSAILCSRYYAANPDGTLKTIAATTDAPVGGTETRDATYPILGDTSSWSGVATAVNNNIYGVYLLAFDHPQWLAPGFLLPLLAWMARNPTKGLPGIAELMRDL
jgi:hypothetical protein